MLSTTAPIPNSSVPGKGEIVTSGRTRAAANRAQDQEKAVQNALKNSIARGDKHIVKSVKQKAPPKQKRNSCPTPHDHVKEVCNVCSSRY